MTKRNFRGKNYIFPNQLGSGGSCKIDFEFAIDLFKEEYMYDAWQPRTLKFHLENLNVFRKYMDLSADGLGGSEDITEITEETLVQFVKSMRAGRKKVNTINGRIKTLRVFFRILMGKGYIDSNPADNLRSIKGQDVSIIPFSDHQVKLLFAQPNTRTFVGLRDLMIMQILLDTGVRLEGLVNIRVRDINLREKSILIPKEKGYNSRYVLFGNETKKTIMKYINHTGLDQNDFLLLSQDKKHLDKRSVQDRIAFYGKKARIEGVRVSCHTFRHTFAKNYLMAGGDALVLQRLLGHKDMAMVKIYVTLFDIDVKIKYEGKSPVDIIRR